MESPSGNPAAGKRPRGRPPKKEYAPALLMQELIDAAAEVYRATQELKAAAAELSLPPNKVKKLLITGKALHYPETEQIQSLLAEGKPMGEVQKILRLRYSSIQTYLPYARAAYKMADVSQNGERLRRYRERKAAVERLKAAPTEENLWQCIAAFQQYPFRTMSGLPFSYTLKLGRSGGYTKELFIDRRENSKSLAWSSIKLAFHKALEQPGAIFARPKELADVRGASYSFSLLWRFGVIRVPDEVEAKLRGGR